MHTKTKRHLYIASLVASQCITKSKKSTEIRTCRPANKTAQRTSFALGR